MHEFSIFADYFQFYIQDEAADGDLSDAWTDEAVERMLATEAGAVVLPGVRIGRGAVVGSLALVAHDVDELTVVAGQPARPIRKLEPPPNWT